MKLTTIIVGFILGLVVTFVCLNYSTAFSREIKLKAYWGYALEDQVTGFTIFDGNNVPVATTDKVAREVEFTYNVINQAAFYLKAFDKIGEKTYYSVPSSIITFVDGPPEVKPPTSFLIIAVPVPGKATAPVAKDIPMPQ